MRKKTALILSAMLMGLSFAALAQVDTLRIHFYENFPYSYREGSKTKGIEIEIMDAYVVWMRQKKNVEVIVEYTPYTEFSAFYASVKEGGSKVVGMGSVTDNGGREKEVQFSPPYLENVAVLITDGTVPTVRSKNPADVLKVFGSMSAMTVNHSSHQDYLNAFKKQYANGLKINVTEKQSQVLEAIAGDKKVFGYVDIISYWAYLKMNPSRFLKIQKQFSDSKEKFGFIMPKKSWHAPYLNEFFESGFGFTSTMLYHQILEKYLGYEIIGSVELK